jgi:hypothetical protein
MWPEGRRALKGRLEEDDMTTLYGVPVSYLIAAALVLFGAWACVHGARMVGRGLSCGAALDVIRGIRFAIYALVSGFFALGLVSARTGFITFGAIILAEELYETGVLALLVRWGDRGPADTPSLRSA